MLRILAAVALLAGAATGAHAMDGNVTEKKVTFTNQELRDPEKLGETYRRLYAVAQEVCWSDAQGPLSRRADDRACEDQAMDEAIADLGSREMRRFHKARAAAQMASADNAGH